MLALLLSITLAGEDDSLTALMCNAAAAGSTAANSLANMPQKSCSASCNGNFLLGLTQTLVQDQLPAMTGAEVA